MPQHSTKERDLHQLTAAVIEESRRLRELFKVKAEELRITFKQSRDLHERYHGRDSDQFTVR
jgi:hypothetical protein